MCMIVKKERTSIPQCNTLENFYSWYGATHGCVQEIPPGYKARFSLKTLSKNHPLVTWQNIAGSRAGGGGKNHAQLLDGKGVLMDVDGAQHTLHIVAWLSQVVWPYHPSPFWRPNTAGANEAVLGTGSSWWLLNSSSHLPNSRWFGGCKMGLVTIDKFLPVTTSGWRSPANGWLVIVALR